MSKKLLALLSRLLALRTDVCRHNLLLLLPLAKNNRHPFLSVLFVLAKAPLAERERGVGFSFLEEMLLHFIQLAKKKLKKTTTRFFLLFPSFFGALPRCGTATFAFPSRLQQKIAQGESKDPSIAFHTCSTFAKKVLLLCC